MMNKMNKTKLYPRTFYQLVSFLGTGTCNGVQLIEPEQINTEHIEKIIEAYPYILSDGIITKASTVDYTLYTDKLVSAYINLLDKNVHVFLSYVLAYWQMAGRHYNDDYTIFNNIYASDKINDAIYKINNIKKWQAEMLNRKRYRACAYFFYHYTNDIPSWLFARIVENKNIKALTYIAELHLADKSDTAAAVLDQIYANSTINAIAKK